MTVQPAVASAAALQAPATTEPEVEALAAARGLAEALKASPEFEELARAEERLAADTDANAAIDAFGRRQAELRAKVSLGALDPAERAELERLQVAVLAFPSMQAYLAARAGFQAACRETAEIVSGEIGVDFAANCCSGSCCG